MALSLALAALFGQQFRSLNQSLRFDSSRAAVVAVDPGESSHPRFARRDPRVRPVRVLRGRDEAFPRLPNDTNAPGFILNAKLSELWFCAK